MTHKKENDMQKEFDFASDFKDGLAIVKRIIAYKAAKK